MLSFVDALKQIIANIQATGGMTIERTLPSPQLLQGLREYAVQCLAETTGSYHLEEWFTEGFFEEYVRACAVHLYKLGISQDDRIYHLLSKVIDVIVRDKYKVQDKKRFEDQLVNSLTIIWDDMGDEQTRLYIAAEKRWLIAWDYQKSQWKVTGLGRMFLELSPVQAAIFFLSIDTLFATDKHDFHHINSDILADLQSPQPYEDESFVERLYPHRNILTQLGIFFMDPDIYNIYVTPIGQTVLRAVLSQDNPFRDAALAIIRTEEVGGTFNESASEINEILQLVNQTHLINQANRESIETGVQLYRTRKYLNSLRVIYPSIEAIINTMLIEAREVPERFRGLVAKAQRLEQQGIIPYDVAHAMEVFTGRNTVVHGNFSPPEDYVFPLCLLAFRYLRRLLTEYHPMS